MPPRLLLALILAALPYAICSLISPSESTAVMSQLHRPPIVYTIAGSDPSGGAGIKADMLSIHDFG